MTGWWIVGGSYTDTTFTTPKAGSEERHGPYADAEAARRAWAGLSMAHVDDAMARYRIEHPGGLEWWVVGGAYTDTGFTTPASGAEERHGPFADEDEARAAWRGLSMGRVDEALVRFRVEQG